MLSRFDTIPPCDRRPGYS